MLLDWTIQNLVNHLTSAKTLISLTPTPQDYLAEYGDCLDFEGDWKNL